MKFITKILLILITVILSSCVANKKSMFIENENIKINMLKAIYFEQDVESLPSNYIDDGGGDEFNLFGSFIPDLVLKWGVNKISTQFEKEAKKYKATYNVKNSYDDFFDPEELEIEQEEIEQEEIKPDDLGTFNYAGFEILRLIKTDTVSRIRLDFELNKSQKFVRIKPSALIIEKTKAKLLKKDNNVDIEINIKIKSFWIDKKGVFQNKELLNSDIKIGNIELGKYYCNLIRCEYENLENEENIELGNVILDKSTDWFPIIPISIDNNRRIGNGNFTIDVTVTEVDDYGEKVTKHKELFDSNKDDIIKGIKEIIGNE